MMGQGSALNKTFISHTLNFRNTKEKRVEKIQELENRNPAKCIDTARN